MAVVLVPVLAALAVVAPTGVFPVVVSVTTIRLDVFMDVIVGREDFKGASGGFLLVGCGLMVLRKDALWNEALLRFGISPGPSVPTDGKPLNVSIRCVNSYINVATIRQLLTTLGFFTGLSRKKKGSAREQNRSERVILQAVTSKSSG